MSKVQCTKCKEMVDEVCGGEHCRDCHISIGWEECLDGSWNDRQRAAAGLPPAFEDLRMPKRSNG